MTDRGGRPGADDTITPLWLSHHYPEAYDRCVVVGRRHVCRRCLVLYPLAFAVMALSLAGTHWPSGWDPWLLALLPLPAVVEFVLEHLGRLRYRAGRQVAVTVVLAVGLGRGFALYVQRPTSPLFWAVVIGYSLVCLAAVIWSASISRPRAR